MLLNASRVTVTCRSCLHRPGSVPHSRLLLQSCARGHWRYIPEPAGMLHAKCWGLNVCSARVSTANWRCAILACLLALSCQVV